MCAPIFTSAILTLEKFNKICRHSGAVPRRDRHPGSSCSDSAPAPGEESYPQEGLPESPAAKPQTDYFTDVAHGTKEGDSGYFITLRFMKFRNDGKVRIAVPIPTLLSILFISLLMSTYYSPVQAQVVVIDPGHGYTSTGADPDGRTDTEHATALAVGLKLRSQIQNSCSNWTVRMTRTTRNGWVSLSQRRTMSNSWRADRFISIHCNAGGGSGTETFWCNRSNSKDADNSRFSGEIQARMVEKGQWISRRSVEDASYIFHLAVLSGNNAIGVLNEIGFVDTGDKNKLLNDTWRNRFAEAYLIALRNSLGNNCTGGGTPPPSSDTQAPTTTISAVGGTTQTGDFTVNFNDQDNVGVTRRFYQVLEQYGSNWYANRGNGFFNDNFNVFYSGYTLGSGNWAISNQHLRQSNTTATNTALTTFLSQASGLPYLYEFSAKLISTTGPRKFGIHLMADSPTLSQRGNSYLVWFNGQQNQVTIYKTINNQLFTQQVANVALDNQWANYKITYSPAFGVLEVFRNNQSLLRWTDTSPIATGSSISLRTNATAVEFDDLKVYKFRANGSVAVSAGPAVTDDLRTANGKIKSLVRDAAGNWSAPGNLDVTISSGASLVASARLAPQDIQVYPNPTDGSSVSLTYEASDSQTAQVSLLDFTGRVINTKYDQPKPGELRRVELSQMFEHVPSGYYLIQLRHGGEVRTARIIKQ